MKAMRDYFKSEADFIEFVILHMDGEQRTDILGITPRHYRDHELAAQWAENIISKISDEDAINRIAYTYHRMVGDMNAPVPGIAQETEETEETKVEETKTEEVKRVIVFTDSNNETTEVDADAWVFKYLSKKGKSLDTLEKAIMRMTKAELLEKFPTAQWGIIEDHSKTEMLSIILTALWDMGYKQAA